MSSVSTLIREAVLLVSFFIPGVVILTLISLFTTGVVILTLILLFTTGVVILLFQSAVDSNPPLFLETLSEPAITVLSLCLNKDTLFCGLALSEHLQRIM